MRLKIENQGATGTSGDRSDLKLEAPDSLTLRPGEGASLGFLSV